MSEYLRDPGASTVGIQPWCALHHCLLIHAGHTQYTYHTEHTCIIICTCKWRKNLQQESQNYHSTTHYACPLSELFVHGDLAKMDTRDGVRRICQMLFPKDLCNSKLTWSEHLFWSVADETAYKDLAAKHWTSWEGDSTLPGKMGPTCKTIHAYEACTFYTPLLRKCQKNK